MIEIEKETPRLSTCECCGGATTTLVRFVYKDGSAHAVYYAAFAETHPERMVTAMIGIGEWGVGSVPESRSAFALRLWPGDTGHYVEVLDAMASPWANAELIGQKLTREQALAHPLLPEVFHLSDHMISDDEQIKRYLAVRPQS